MTNSIHQDNGTRTIEAYRVTEHARIGTLPRHFGFQMTTVEQTVYRFMDEFVAGYAGGFWDFYDLSNGGFYMAPRCAPVNFSVASNGFEGTLSADAAGIVVCLFTFGYLSFGRAATEAFSRHFHQLRDFALDHQDARLIFAATD